ncbi:MAG: acetylesterase [Planctomycetes bacterium]|nr:acetylesterase [Planctomycetota bacterium]
MRELAAVTVVLSLAATACLCAAEKPPVPDLTKGGEPDKTHDWTLGPTGARGWMWAWVGHTTDARQILVTDVAKGSPADGTLAKGDVLLGVDGRPFADDARIAFAHAITQAESEKAGGILRLLRWREGKTEGVQVKLPVLGTYSGTAPYDCPKTRRVLDLACQAIARKPMEHVTIPNDMNALALLASGRPEYKQMVADYARKVAAHQPGGHVTWGYAYATLFLAEYAIATRDEAVVPGLRRLALDIARGQSGVGTWGHAFARADGILNGYGAMNQPGIVLTIAMTLTREAGVKDPVLDRAIAKAAGFLRWYVNKGAIPYGDHDPWPWHDDNGKCSSAAVLFDLLGDREAAAFFARMAVAAHAERESGHTGNFFNVTWALPGVARAGPAATAAYLKEQAWYYDLARGWDGTLLYPGVPGNWGGHSYGGWDCTGAFLLGYALPLKSLYLTGRKPSVVPALSQAEAKGVVDAGRDFTYWTEKTCYDGRDTEALLAGLASWSPAVRKRSAQALSRREGDLVPRLLKLLDSKDVNARYGAVEALGLLGPRADAAGPKLFALLREDDPWLLCLAAEALARMGPDVRKAAVPELLRLTVREVPADPRRHVQRAVGIALFSPMPGKREPRSILAESLDGVDRKLLYPAVKAVLENEDGATRGLLRGVYGKLDDRDIVALLPAILKAIKEPSPSDEMFSDSIRLAGLDLLSRLRIREGMAMCVELMEPNRWGQGHRIPTCLGYLARYGGNAKPLIPQLKDVREAIAKHDRKSETVPAIDKAIAKIEADPTPPSLLSLKDFAAAAPAAATLQPNEVESQPSP